MKDKVRVVEIISDTNFGGAGQYLKSIVTEIDREKFELIVIMPVDSVLKNILRDVDIFYCPDINEKSFSLKGTYNLFRMIRNIRPSVVHTHGSLSGRLAAQLLGVDSIIYTKHTLSDNSVKWKRGLKRVLNRILRSKAIAISRSVQMNLIEEGIKEDRIRMIYNGIKPIETFDRNERLTPIISLVGRLETIKGHRHMIEITKRLIGRYGDRFQVMFVGTGSLETILKSTAETHGLPIVFSGHVDDIGSIYENSDIIVNTSDSEALSYAALESMIYKKPVVAFDIPGINEVIEDGKTGFLVEYMNYDLFVDCLVRLLSDDTLRKQMGELGRERVIERFSIKEMIKGIESLYMEGL